MSIRIGEKEKGLKILKEISKDETKEGEWAREYLKIIKEEEVKRKEILNKR